MDILFTLLFGFNSFHNGADLTMGIMFNDGYNACESHGTYELWDACRQAAIGYNPIGRVGLSTQIADTGFSISYEHLSSIPDTRDNPDGASINTFSINYTVKLWR